MTKIFEGGLDLHVFYYLRPQQCGCPAGEAGTLHGLAEALGLGLDEAKEEITRAGGAASLSAAPCSKVSQQQLSDSV